MKRIKQLPDCGAALGALSKKIPARAKFAFVSTFLTGLLIHLYMFTGKYPNHDEIYNLYSANTGDGFGRWMLHLYTSISSEASLPLVIGVICLVTLSVSCVLITSLLHIQKRYQIFLTGLILVSLPSIANGFTWMHCADGFLIAMMLGVLSAFVTDRYRLGFLPGLFLLVFALAGYQASLCMSVAVLAVRYLQRLLEKRETDRDMLLLLGKYAVCVFGGTIVYVLSTRYLLPALTGEALFSYSGIDTMGSLSLSQLPGRFLRAYYEFAQYLLRTTMIVSWRFVRYWQMAIGALEITLILVTLFRTPAKSPLQTALALLITALLPVLFTSICLMTDSAVHVLMLNSLSLFYVLLLVSQNALADSCLGTPHLSERRLKGRRRRHGCVGLAPNTTTGMRHSPALPCRRMRPFNFAEPKPSETVGFKAEERGIAVPIPSDDNAEARCFRRFGRVRIGVACLRQPAARHVNFAPLAGYAVAVLLVVMGLVYAVSDNELYLGLQLKYENCYALANRVVSDVEKAEGYVVGETPVYIGGSLTATYPNSKEFAFKPLSHQNGFQSATEYNLLISDKHFHFFVRDYIGLLLDTADADAAEAAMQTQAYKDMPVYPYAGSVRMIDGILFVKASN